MLSQTQEAAAALREDRPEAAVDILLRMMERQAPGANALRIFVRACRKQGRMAFAVEYLAALRKRHPGNADLAAELAYCHQLSGDAESAGRETLRGLAANPTHPGLNLLLVNKNKRAGDADAARAILAAMCQAERAAPNNLRDFARQLTEFGLHDQAAAIWRKLIARHPEAYVERVGLALCELKQGHIEEAARIAEEAGRHSGGQARHLALVDLIAAAAPPDVAGSMRALRQELFAAAPIPRIQKLLGDARQRLFAIRAEPASRALARNQTLKASFICPIHRPRDVANAVAQMQHQDWRNAEAIFAVNSQEIADAAIADLWHSSVPLRIVDCRALGTLGAVLNRAITGASGDFIFKFDADDRYFPAYCTDMILQAEYFAADLVEKPGKFFFVEQTQAITLESFADIYAASRGGPSAGGSTLCIRRHLFDDIRFNEQCRVAEDVLFHAACAAAGARLALADPFNYLAIRSADVTNHTWRIDAVLLAMLRDTALIGGGDAAAIVTV